MVKMHHVQLLPKLRRLKLSGILQTLDVRAAQATERQLSPLEFLALLLDDELERRDQRLRAALQAVAGTAPKKATVGNGNLGLLHLKNFRLSATILARTEEVFDALFPCFRAPESGKLAHRKKQHHREDSGDSQHRNMPDPNPAYEEQNATGGTQHQRGGKVGRRNEHARQCHRCEDGKKAFLQILDLVLTRRKQACQKQEQCQFR